MPVSVTCPGCGKRYKVPDTKIGSAIGCKQCDTQIFVSADGDESKRLRSRRGGAVELSDGDLQKRKIGVTLMILGVGSLLLPMMGLQFRVLALMGESAQLVGAGLAYLGAMMFVVAMRSQPLTAAIVGGGAAAATTFLAAPFLQQLNGGPGGPAGPVAPPQMAQNDAAPPPAAQPGPQGQPARPAPPGPQAAHQPDQSGATGPSGRPGGARPGFGPGNRPPFGRPGQRNMQNGGPQGRPQRGNPAAQRGRQTSASGSRQTQLDLSRSADTTPVNLLDVIQPARDQLIGGWALRNGALTSPVMQPARIDVPVIPPQSYVLTIDAERLRGIESLNIGLVVGGRGVTVILDGYGGQTAGLNRLDGRTADINEATFRGKLLHPGRTNTIVCTVGPNSVQVTCNGQQAINWTGNPQRLSRDHRWTPGRDDHLQLGCWATRWKISRMELTPVP